MLQLDEFQLVQYFHKFKKQVPVRDRVHKFHRYKSCFTGKDACNVFEESFKLSPSQAIDLGNLLLNKKLIVHVSHKKTFKNGNYFYQFSNYQRVSKTLFALNTSSTSATSTESSQPNTPDSSSLSNSPAVKTSELENFSIQSEKDSKKVEKLKSRSKLQVSLRTPEDETSSSETSTPYGSYSESSTLEKSMSLINFSPKKNTSFKAKTSNIFHSCQGEPIPVSVPKRSFRARLESLQNSPFTPETPSSPSNDMFESGLGEKSKSSNTLNFSFSRSKGSIDDDSYTGSYQSIFTPKGKKSGEDTLEEQIAKRKWKQMSFICASTSGNTTSQITLWQLNYELFISKNYSIDEIMEHEGLRKVLYSFAMEEFSEENLDFYQDYMFQFKIIPEGSIFLQKQHEMAIFLYNKYLKPNCELPLNVSAQMIKNCTAKYLTKENATCFDEIFLDVKYRIQDIVDRLRVACIDYKQKLKEVKKSKESSLIMHNQSKSFSSIVSSLSLNQILAEDTKPQVSQGQMQVEIADDNVSSEDENEDVLEEVVSKFNEEEDTGFANAELQEELDSSLQFQ